MSRTSEALKSLRRVRIFVIVMALAFISLTAQAFWLQGLNASATAQAAAAKMTHTRDLEPVRGAITDRNGIVLAQTTPAVRLVADPWVIATNGVSRKRSMTQKEAAFAAAAPAAIADILVTYLGGNKDAYIAQLTRETRADGKANMYEVLATQVSAWLYQQISAALSAAKLNGIYKEDTPIRSYPTGTLASNVVGFVNHEGVGQAGIEYSFNERLAGIKGQESFQSSTYGRIPLGESTLIPAIDGNTYTLTIDSELQAMAQTELAQAIQTSGAKTGSALVMNVKTGELLAMATNPSYDANDLSTAKAENLGNRVVSDTYEPGSVHKVLTMAALIDSGTITPDTQVVVPTTIDSGGGKIGDAFSHGTLYLTARGVLAYSSNVGTVLLARQASKATLADYYTSFGLGSPTGIELPGEGSGTLGLVPKASMPDYTRDQISFGQGISVTMLQEAAALAGIVNGGVYNTPTIIKSATSGDGEPLAVSHPDPVRIVSEQTSEQVLNMMEAVIASPKWAADRCILGYRMAGKSGTAERVDRRTGRYSGYVASFVTVAPVEDPQILVYVVLDQPSNAIFGSVVAMPPARNLMSVALPRYGVEPSSTITQYDDPLSFTP